MAARLRIAPVTPADARAFASWRYPPPYSVYDPDPAEWEHYLDPRWGYWSVLDEAGRPIGNCCFGEDARVPGGDYAEAAVDIGAGMRPELTGQGGGREFLAAVVGEAERLHPGLPLRATVAAFNRRALRVVGSLGFAESSRFRRADGMEFAVFLLRRAG